VTAAAGLSPLRVFAFALALGVLALAGLTGYRHAAHPPPPAAPLAAERELAKLQLNAAARALSQLHELTATYEEADLHVIRRLHLVRASETSYCVQVVEGDGFLFHLDGPGGRVTGGPCRR
jgi:hypothetical protein